MKALAPVLSGSDSQITPVILPIIALSPLGKEDTAQRQVEHLLASLGLQQSSVFLDFSDSEKTMEMFALEVKGSLQPFGL